MHKVINPPPPLEGGGGGVVSYQDNLCRPQDHLKQGSVETKHLQASAQ